MARTLTATYKQPQEAKAIMKASAMEKLSAGILERPSKDVAEETGVTVRTVNRWKASLTGSGSQARNPFKQSGAKLAAAAGPVSLHVSMTLSIGGDDEYSVERSTDVDMDEDFLALALEDPDAAWDEFFDVYGINPGIIEEAEVYFE